MADSSHKLNVSVADRKLWLVKVPIAVANVWKRKCEDSLNKQQVDVEEENNSELARLKFVTSQGQGAPQIFLDIPDASGETIPKRYKLQASRDIPAINVFSFPNASEEAKDANPPRVEGVISDRYDVTPISTFMGQDGQQVLDPAYRAFSAARTKAATTKLRHVEFQEDTREARMAMSGNSNHMRALAKEAKAASIAFDEKRKEEKRTKMEEGLLEAKLFELFDKTPHWNFLQLQKETNQPAAYLKVELLKIAVLVKRGPNRDMYQLKPQFRGGRNEDDEAEDGS